MSTEKSAVVHDEEVVPPQNLAHVAGDALLVAPDGQVRKLPIPSSDPSDPLNYSKWEKLAVVVACCWFYDNHVSRSDWWIDSGHAKFIRNNDLAVNSGRDPGIASLECTKNDQKDTDADCYDVDPVEPAPGDSGLVTRGECQC